MKTKPKAKAESKRASKTSSKASKKDKTGAKAIKDEEETSKKDTEPGETVEEDKEQEKAEDGAEKKRKDEPSKDVKKIKDEEFDNDKQDIETLGFQLEEILITFESVPGINNAYLNELRQAIEDLKNYLNLNLQPQESLSDIEEKPKKRVIMVVEMINCAQCLDYIDIRDFMNLDDE